MLTVDELNAIERIVQEAVQNTDFINKVWIAGSTVVVSIAAVVVSAIGLRTSTRTQKAIAKLQREVQVTLADQQAQQQKQALADQLAMQELASRRIANANVSAKRQVWIDGLREDLARYLTLWQEISFRWDAAVNQPRTELMSDEELEAFKRPIAEMRMEALEAKLRIELRLNLVEAKHKELKGLMKTMEGLTTFYQRTISSLPPPTIQATFQKAHQEAVAKAQEILKDEWERIKKESYIDPAEVDYAVPVEAEAEPVPQPA